MKNPHLPSLSATVLLALVAADSCFGLTPTEWRFHQALSVPAPGLVRVNLSSASFDAGGAQMEAFRVLDPAGNETAILVDRPPVPVAHIVRPSTFETKVDGGTTEILLSTGTSEKMSSVVLETPAPAFLRAAKIEVSQNNADWTLVDKGVPVFREWGAEKLSLPLAGRSAAFLRITIEDGKADSTIPFTGATIQMEAPPPPAPSEIDARIVSRDEFVGETVLTLALGGQNIPLAAISLETKEPLFMRRVSVAIRELKNAIPSERVIGSGTVFRVAVNGSPSREQVELPLIFTPTTRELLIHIHNGDAPPLSIDAVKLKRWPVSLLYMAPAAGNYTLLSGNPQALPPHYDLAGFAGELRGATASVVVPGNREETANYHPAETLGSPPLPDIPLLGAPLDTKDWAFRNTVQVSDSGVQELELDLDALSKTRSDFSDVRLLKGGNQIPYILEQPAVARSLPSALEENHDPKRATVSIWTLHLPKAGLPIRSLVLSATTALFQRQFRIYEKVVSQDGGSYESTLATGEWDRTPQPGVADNRIFDLNGRTRTDTLWIECDNGDNPAIKLGTTQIIYPVVRLVFKATETDGLLLVYGNREVTAPRYDLSLVAERLLTSPRSVAHLGEVPQGNVSSNPFAGIKGGIVFWGALVLVVAALLVVVAKLLPKPAP
jgi:hypothetical protein